MPRPLMDYLSMKPSALAGALEREISDEERGFFYRWMDDEKNGAFSDACLELHQQIVIANEEENYAKSHYAFAVWTKKMCDYIEEYRREKGLDESKIFLDSLNK